jgi:hypothetical protein
VVCGPAIESVHWFSTVILNPGRAVHDGAESYDTLSMERPCGLKDRGSSMS